MVLLLLQAFMPFLALCALAAPVTTYNTSAPVSLRAVVITYNRAKSLERLLLSLRAAHYDGDRIDLDIWIDKPASGEDHDVDTVLVSNVFEWPHGVKTVHLQPVNAGVVGQWRDTWQPEADTKEMGLILEDDLELSVFYYRWLKAAYEAYQDRDDIYGFDISRLYWGPLEGPKNGTKSADLLETDIIFLFPHFGSWGFSPKASFWHDFQAWYYDKRDNHPDFEPVMEGNSLWGSYLKDKKAGKTSSMFSAWIGYYAKERIMYCLYLNLPGRLTLSTNYQEPGIHFNGLHVGPNMPLVTTWMPELSVFPQSPKVLGWDKREVSHITNVADRIIRFSRQLRESNPNNDVAISFIGDSDIEFAKNWLCSTAHLNVHSHTVLIASSIAFEALRGNSFVVAVAHMQAEMADANVVSIIGALLQTRLGFWVFDVNCVWRQSPFIIDLQATAHIDMVFSGSGLMGGVAYFYATVGMSKLFAEGGALMKESEGTSTDPTAAKYLGLSLATIHRVDSIVLPNNGNTHRFQVSINRTLASTLYKTTSTPADTVSTVLQFDPSLDRADKIALAKSLGLWALDDDLGCKL